MCISDSYYSAMREAIIGNTELPVTPQQALQIMALLE